MKLEQIRENPDGSADFMVTDITDEEASALIRMGIIKAIETAIEESKKYEVKNENQSVPCKDHPDAPHGFDRNASHSLGRYVCECEGWTPDEEQK